MIEDPAGMEVRLVQLLESFVSATSAYTLTRLEFALRNPRSSIPPVIDRLSEASSATLRAEWPRIETQLETAHHDVRRLDDQRGKRAVYDPFFAALQRNVRELEQYARAVRWIMTVEEGR